jgi:hypothetical protein
LLISAAIFLALPETAHAQIWVSSGFKAGSDAQHITAYCSTSAVDPTTGISSPTAADYYVFFAGCSVTSSRGETYSTNPDQCPSYGSFHSWSNGMSYAGNPTGICTLSFPSVVGVTYTITSVHWLWMIDSGDCGCFKDPEGFASNPPKTFPD